MRLFQLEQTPAVYRADFWIYGAFVGIGVPSVLWLAAPDQRSLVGLLVAIGFVTWSPLEYGLHRWVLHGIRPFRDWHAVHHERPVALVASPTLFTLALFGALVWLPMSAAYGYLYASSLTLGLMAGYLCYAATHHAVHHWVAKGPWLRRQKLWHARHHHATMDDGVCFGVTGTLWDRLFKSDRLRAH